MRNRTTALRVFRNLTGSLLTIAVSCDTMQPCQQDRESAVKIRRSPRCRYSRNAYAADQNTLKPYFAEGGIKACYVRSFAPPEMASEEYIFVRRVQ